ncbi:hypothetical protein A2U01_0025255 [Trifolium medium]|uniref:Uncharacterized protein n=1 Tax=Trifolium medium TaxID=97028 RepID=A0A392NWN4_9FABA|nr:hypothetical protein [Trifolium medium]
MVQSSNKFWVDLLSHKYMARTLVLYVDIRDLHLTMKDVLSSTSPHFQILYTQLPPVVTNYINNMHVKFNGFVTDSLWHHVGFTDPTFFSLSTAYDWLKTGSTGSQAFTFSASVWWGWMGLETSKFVVLK